MSLSSVAVYIAIAMGIAAMPKVRNDLHDIIVNTPSELLFPIEL